MSRSSAKASPLLPATATTIVTLRLDPAAQHAFNALRRQHYPAALNQIDAHLTLFHTLPATPAVAEALTSLAADTTAFPIAVTGLMPLGRGVAYRVESNTLQAVHGRLREAFSEHLSAQDRQPFRPHIVIQNKVAPPRPASSSRRWRRALRRTPSKATVSTGGIIWAARGGCDGPSLSPPECLTGLRDGPRLPEDLLRTLPEAQSLIGDRWYIAGPSTPPLRYASGLRSG